MSKKGKKVLKEIANKGPKLVGSKTYASEFGGAGKGDSPRPIDKKKFDENYDQIFRKEKGQDSCSVKCKCKCKQKKKNE